MSEIQYLGDCPTCGHPRWLMPQCTCGHLKAVHMLGKLRGKSIHKECSRSGCDCTRFTEGPKPPANAGQEGEPK